MHKSEGRTEADGGDEAPVAAAGRANPSQLTERKIRLEGEVTRREGGKQRQIL